MRTLIAKDPYLDHPESSFWVRAYWPASWISHVVAPTGEPCVVAFRLRVTLDAPLRIRAHVSADERYRLFIDGAPVGRGPERGEQRHWYFETYDLDLAAGEHVIVGLTWSFGLSGPAPFAQLGVRTGFLFAVEGQDPARFNTGQATGWQSLRIGGVALT
ncbi:MAG: alpha-L-rhamnosidase, partial [Planctomycetes bacterium]|nr:alpha-L-rhamnosidase [Planctomycetota bacterium]